MFAAEKIRVAVAVVNELLAVEQDKNRRRRSFSIRTSNGPNSQRSAVPLAPSFSRRRNGRGDPPDLDRERARVVVGHTAATRSLRSGCHWTIRLPADGLISYSTRGRYSLQELTAPSPKYFGRAVAGHLIVQWIPTAKSECCCVPTTQRGPFPIKIRWIAAAHSSARTTGASGTALLCELAHSMFRIENERRRDLSCSTARSSFTTATATRIFLGANIFARNTSPIRQLTGYRAGILLDMVGDAHCSSSRSETACARRSRSNSSTTFGASPAIWRPRFLFGQATKCVTITWPSTTSPKNSTIDIIDFDYSQRSRRQLTGTRRKTFAERCSPLSSPKVGWSKTWLERAKVMVEKLSLVPVNRLEAKSSRQIVRKLLDRPTPSKGPVRSIFDYVSE